MGVDILTMIEKGMLHWFGYREWMDEKRMKK